MDETKYRDAEGSSRAALAESNAILEAVGAALAGEPVSDFMESFPVVRVAVDMRSRIAELDALHKAEVLSYERRLATMLNEASAMEARIADLEDRERDLLQQASAWEAQHREEREAAAKRIAELEAAWLEVCHDGNVPQYEEAITVTPEAILHGVRQLASMWSTARVLYKNAKARIAELEQRQSFTAGNVTLDQIESRDRRIAELEAEVERLRGEIRSAFDKYGRGIPFDDFRAALARKE